MFNPSRTLRGSRSFIARRREQSRQKRGVELGDPPVGLSGLSCAFLACFGHANVECFAGVPAMITQGHAVSRAAVWPVKAGNGVLAELIAVIRAGHTEEKAGGSRGLGARGKPLRLGQAGNPFVMRLRD